jgi:kynurenine formamidase
MRPLQLLSLLLAGCAGAGAARDPLAGRRWIDLSHEFSSETIYWPTATPFRLDSVFRGQTPGGWHYEANNFSAAEHGGTHLDAPVHFAAAHQTTEQVPLSNLMGLAIVVDVSDSARANRDYRVELEDLRGWETRQRQPIPKGAVVLLRTGWGSRWPDRAEYLGTTKTGTDAIPELHFPGLAPAAAERLVQAYRVKAVGIDTPSIDHGQSTTFATHQVLAKSDVPIFENVANLDSLPPIGAYVIALPMKIRGGSGGPLRIVAALPQ